MAATAAHELVHGLDMIVPTCPHACFLDAAHVCDVAADLMHGGEGSVPRLSEMSLDAGHDDYYETPGPQYDVRTTPWLEHLDAPAVKLTVATEPAEAGTVHLSSTTFTCTQRCDVTVEGDAKLSVWEEPAPGYAFDGWTGACGSEEPLCAGTLSGDTQAVAHFVPLVGIPVVVKGRGTVGTVAEGDLSGDECRHHCTWKLPRGKRFVLVAHPGRHMHFAGWEGHGCRTHGRNCVVVVDARTRPVAVFEPA